ncbi:MAG: amidohydrolase family protein [Alphaproteobacteria bacterium]|nr:amidohydrolase family protein [Alphaproteobacteria bacterium]
MERIVDSHAHVFCGPELPLSDKRLYTPEPCQAGRVEDFAAVLDSHGVTHGLIVGAQPYHTDNRCLLRAIEAGRGRFKGIALVDGDTPMRELETLKAAGVVGFRINLSWEGQRALNEPGSERLFAQARELGWFVQVHCEREEFAQVAPILRARKVRVMIDHHGRPDPDLGIGQPGFQAILNFGRETNAVCKLSGPFRTSKAGAPYRDVDPFAAAIVDAFTLDRCVWGSDWPFVCVDKRVDYGPQFAALKRWLPDPKDREKVLWSTPARLFGFA